MKHISRRFLFQYSKDEFEAKFADLNLQKLKRSTNSPPLGRNQLKQEFCFLHTDKDYYIRSTLINIDGIKYPIPEPDPTLIYFSSAQNCFRQLNKTRPILLSKVHIQSDISGEIIHDYYDYFSSAFGFVIFLFSSLESFTNSLVKDNDVYTKTTKKNTEIYSKGQIEFLSFDEKTENVIPQLTKIDFMKDHKLFAQKIHNLKEFRNEIIHIKSQNSALPYTPIVKKILSFKYPETIEAVAKFMNSHIPQYINECQCGED
jgi:hypothetical protein